MRIVRTELLGARAELDEAKRSEMYREMQQIARDDGGTVVPFFRNHVYARRWNVTHGEKLTGNRPLDGSRPWSARGSPESPQLEQ